MNILDKNSFKKFLQELVPLFFVKASQLKAISTILNPRNIKNKFNNLFTALPH